MGDPPRLRLQTLCFKEELTVVPGALQDLPFAGFPLADFMAQLFLQRLEGGRAPKQLDAEHAHFAAEGLRRSLASFDRAEDLDQKPIGRVDQGGDPLVRWSGGRGQKSIEKPGVKAGDVHQAHPERASLAAQVLCGDGRRASFVRLPAQAEAQCGLVSLGEERLLRRAQGAVVAGMVTAVSRDAEQESVWCEGFISRRTRGREGLFMRSCPTYREAEGHTGWIQGMKEVGGYPISTPPAPS